MGALKAKQGVDADIARKAAGCKVCIPYGHQFESWLLFC